MSGHCPSDKWFFGSVFVFLIAVGLLVGGAVNMQSAADDPRTPRVKTYDGYVDAWQSTHFDEYSGKYASTTPTISVARGPSAGTGSTTTVSAWTKLETATIVLKDSRSDYKRHNKHFALYTNIVNFHATGKRSEKKNEDVTLTIGSNTIKFHVTDCDVTKVNRKKTVKNAKGEDVEVDVARVGRRGSLAPERDRCAAELAHGLFFRRVGRLEQGRDDLVESIRPRGQRLRRAHGLHQVEERL